MREAMSRMAPMSDSGGHRQPATWLEYEDKVGLDEVGRMPAGWYFVPLAILSLVFWVAIAFWLLA